MLRACFASWWQHIGSTPASGITKLVFSEAGNFPEISQFYQREVVAPGQQLVRRVLERGMARGEFRVLDLDCAVHAVLAPMIFLSLCRHSAHACMPAGAASVRSATSTPRWTFCWAACAQCHRRQRQPPPLCQRLLRCRPWHEPCRFPTLFSFPFC